MEDITNRAAIEVLVNRFYDKVKIDATIGYIFTDVAKVNWEKHLPRMYQFWETVLLGKTSFKGNPMSAHIQLSKKTALKQAHFNRWLSLWNETVEENFKGEIATEAKERGKNIAVLMLYKIENHTT